MRLEVDRLDLALKPLPLLGGRVDVEEVRLVRPVLRVEKIADRAELPQLVGAVAWLPLTAEGPRRLSVVDGQAMLSDVADEGARELDNVNLEVATSDAGSAIVLNGTFAINREPLRVDARLGRLAEDGSSTLRLALASDGEGQAGSSALTFGGVVWWRAEVPRLRGELEVTGNDVRSAAGTLGAALGRRVVPVPSWLAAPFRLAGAVALENDRLELADLGLTLNGIEVRGRLDLSLADPPEVDLVLEIPRLALPAAWVQANALAQVAPLGAVAAGLRGRVALAVAALEYRGETVRRLRASLRLDAGGAAEIEELRALLPGQTDVTFSGHLEGIAGAPQVQGQVAVATQNLRDALAWLGLSSGDTAAGRLNALSLTSGVALIRDEWRFDGLELRLDASRATGAVAIDPGPRPRIRAAVELDRLDVDAYWPEALPVTLLARLAAPLEAVDATIEARLARLTWHGVQLLDVALAAQADAGQLTIEQLTVADVAAARVDVSGAVDLTAGTFNLTTRAKDVQLARLLRRLGNEPPLVLARLRPLAVEGTAQGSLAAADVELEVADGAGKVTIAGQVGLSQQRPHYQLEIAAEHPDYQRLLQDLGAGAAGAPAAGRLAIAGRLEHDREGASLIAGTARLGVTSVTGRLAWADIGSRPIVSARISVGEPTAATLAALLDLSGLQLEWPTPDEALDGRWSERPLATELLERVDGELALSGKGGLAGPGFELAGRLENGTLTVDRVAMALWGGQLSGELSVDSDRPLPYLTAALDLAAFDPAALAAWLGVAPILGGPADLSLRASAAGRSVRELVGALIGEITLRTSADATVRALPPGFLARAATPENGAVRLGEMTTELALKRGVITAPPLNFQVDGSTLQLEGAIDLYLWALDLTLRPEDGGPALRLVGPLDRPQVRVRSVDPGPPEERSP
jgi:uncharacterized protein involved in outer membrane biogenesis